jgi:photosystem II stability/assembly factor-like uncharacterized protein
MAHKCYAHPLVSVFTRTIYVEISMILTLIRSAFILSTVILTSSAVSAQEIQWSPVPIPTTDVVSAIAIKNSGEIFIGTWGSDVYKSTDNGESWSYALQLPPENIYVLHILNSGTILVGANRIYRSDDNGSTWDTVSGVIACTKFGVEYGDAVYATTGRGLYRSTDDGRSWERYKEFDKGYTLFGIARDSSGGMWVGNSIGLYSSTDGGVNWYFNRSLDGDIHNIEIMKSGRILVAMGGGVINSSDDLGQSWSLFLPSWQDGQVKRFQFGQRGDFASAYKAGIIRWNEQEEGWEPVNIGLPSVNAKTGLLTSWGVGILDITEDPFGNLYAIGGKGVFRSSLVNSSVSVSEKSIAPAGFNYSPNPSGDVMNFQYRIEESSRVILDIYTVQGEHMRSVVDEQQSAGEHSTSVNLSDFTPGAYYCRLCIGKSYYGSWLQIRR